MPRALHLFILSLRHSLHKLRYDLARELVVAFCSLVLGSLFYYVFNDFVNERVAELSLALRQDFANGLGLSLLGILAVACGRHLNREQQDHAGFAQLAGAMGEEPRVVARYWCLRVAFLIVLYCGPLTYLTNRVLLRWSPAACMLLVACLLATIALSFFISRALSRKQMPRGWRPLLSADSRSPLAAMYNWRLQQLLRRNRAAQVCLALALLIAACSLALASRPLPLLPAFFLAYLAGLLTAAALVLQVSYDVQYAWIEKNFGVSHDDYQNVLIGLACTLGGVLGGLLTSMHVITSLALRGDGVSWELAGRSLQLGLVGFVSSYLVPYLVFQIDARRAAVQMMTLILVSLFVATALFASLFALILLPVVAYYGRRSQDRRFYRA